jgi:hypothetical protein
MTLRYPIAAAFGIRRTHSRIEPLHFGQRLK